MSDGLELAAAAGIRCLPVPTPFAVGRVNCYLIEDDPLTLVDCGPNSGKALDCIEQMLAEHGRRIEDLGLILLTHQHIDHIGLTEILARRSGAEVAALDLLGTYLADFAQEMERDDELAERIMLRHGVPEQVVYALRTVSRFVRAWGGAAAVTRPLRDGDELELRDRTLQVLRRPGHSPTDTVFRDAGRRIALGGDHLLQRISSNPVIARPLDRELAADERPRALITYMESLRATQELPIDVVLGGHGEPVTGHAELVDERFAMHARRAEKIRGMVAERPLSAHEIAQEMWGRVALTQAYLTVSEVLGHIDLLLRDGAVEQHDDGTTIRFSAR